MRIGAKKATIYLAIPLLFLAVFVFFAATVNAQCTPPYSGFGGCFSSCNQCPAGYPYCTYSTILSKYCCYESTNVGTPCMTDTGETGHCNAQGVCIADVNCFPNWACGDWSPSESAISCGQYFIQTRICKDLNGCNTIEGKPDESQPAFGTYCSSGKTCQSGTCMGASACAYANCEYANPANCQCGSVTTGGNLLWCCADGNLISKTQHTCQADPACQTAQPVCAYANCEAANPANCQCGSVTTGGNALWCCADGDYVSGSKLACQSDSVCQVDQPCTYEEGCGDEGKWCQGGECTDCALDLANCDLVRGCETNIRESEEHCGSCNHSCDSGQTCQNKICVGQDKGVYGVILLPSGPYAGGDSATVSWQTAEIDDVCLGYRKVGTTDYEQIACNEPANGSYPWTVPSDLEGGSYQVYVCEDTWSGCGETGWSEVFAVSGPECVCDDWLETSCGAGGCPNYMMHQTRNCTPSGCSLESGCVNNPICTGPDQRCAEDLGGYCCLPQQCPSSYRIVGATDCSQCCQSSNQCIASSGGGTIEIKNPLTAGNFEDIVDNIINFIFNIAVIIAPIMIIVGGLLFITAGGNVQQIGRARSLLIWTAVGFFIVLLSKGILAIINQILGVQGG